MGRLALGQAKDELTSVFTQFEACLDAISKLVEYTLD